MVFNTLTKSYKLHPALEPPVPYGTLSYSPNFPPFSQQICVIPIAPQLNMKAPRSMND